jgi:hypothetical protein
VRILEFGYLRQIDHRVVHGALVALAGIQPYPDQAISFLNRIRSQVGERLLGGVGCNQRRDIEAFTCGGESPAMIGTPEGVTMNAARAEASALVGASNVGGEKCAIWKSRHHEFDVKESIGQDLVGGSAAARATGCHERRNAVNGRSSESVMTQNSIRTERLRLGG